MPDWKRVRTRIATANWRLQRLLCSGLILISLVLSIVGLFPATDDGATSKTMETAFLRSAAYLAVACVAIWLHYKIMRQRYPKYPRHDEDRDDDDNFRLPPPNGTT